MTQTATPVRKIFNMLSDTEEDLLIEQVVSSAEKVKDETFRGEVIDTITVYKLVSGLSRGLSGDQLDRCLDVLSELEHSLRHFISHQSLPERRLGVRFIFA